MYLALDSGHVDSAIQRISRLIRHFDDINGRFVSLARQIDMDVKNEEAVRIALRSLENDMDCIRRALKKMMEISEDIIDEYLGAHRMNLRDCRDLAADLDTISRWTGKLKDYNESYSFGEYISQINQKLSTPVSIAALIDTETLEKYGLRAIETDIEGNVPVLAWRIPEFK